MVVKSARNAPGSYVYRQSPGPKNASVENNFVGGLKTEFTGLNFPENSCTNTSNCVFSMLGDVTRRGGINFETNAVQQPIDPTAIAMSSYRWRNAGGDGQTELFVQQIGSTIYFYKSSIATIANPISSQLLVSTVNINSFLATGNTNNPALVECQYADGNGYLFLFHPYCDSIACTFSLSNNTIQASAITINIRDFQGVPDGLGIGPTANPSSINVRPTTLSNEHKYNLLNQGWTNATPWSSIDTEGHLSFTNPPSGGTVITIPTGNVTYAVAPGINNTSTIITTGQACHISAFFNFQNVALEISSTTLVGSGVVVSYNNSTGQLVVNVTSSSNLTSSIRINGINATFNFINTISSISLANTIGPGTGSWNNSVHNYPSNADIWWVYKDTNNNFAPSLATGNSIIPGSAPAPQGHFIYNAFNQNFSAAAGLFDNSGNPLITPISTTSRCSTGAWYAGRVWFSGISASQQATGDQPYYTWTENIYFSQVITSTQQFGNCYQVNDPTNQNFFNLLPTDGGVITIPGCGAIYTLFPIIAGLLVFAQNGVWFITGGQSISFSATDFVVSQISKVQSISATSFVNVLGVPFWWNQEGIYTISQNKQQTGIPYAHGGLIAEPLTAGTILSYYAGIPVDSKLYARGDYDPNTYILQWAFKGTQETGIGDRYHLNTMLCFNVYTKSFYVYNISSNGSCFVSDVVFTTYPNSANGLNATFKYPTAAGTNFTFSEENDFTDYRDWFTFDNVGVDYTSTFTTGYKIKGMAFKRWKPIYLIMYLRNNTASSYTINAIWDFNNTALGRTSTSQTIVSYTPEFGMIYRRHKLRGHGRVMQIEVTSVSGKPFDIMGWAMPEAENAGV